MFFNRFLRLLLTMILLNTLFGLKPAGAHDKYPFAIVDKQPVTKVHAGPRIGLALGGGGSRGACHIGVLKVLEQEGIPIDYITGNSAGAIAGGLYAAGVPIAQIENMINDKSLCRAYYTIPLTLRMSLVPVTMVPRLCGYHPYAGLYRGDKFAAFIDKCLPPERRKIENTVIPFHAVTTDLLTGEIYVVEKGSLAKALQASAAVPGIRKPVAMDGRLLDDGMFTANLPTKQVREMGADIVICVNSDGPVKTVEAKDLRGIHFSQNRISNLVVRPMDIPGMKEADIVITPDVADIDLTSTKISDAKKAIAEGEKAAHQAMPEIRRLLHMNESKLVEADTKPNNP